MDLDFENCENVCTKSALPSQIVMICESTKHGDIFEISDRLVHPKRLEYVLCKVVQIVLVITKFYTHLNL